MHQLEKEREERKRVRREQREEEKRQRVLAEEEAAEALKTPQQTSFLMDLLEVGGSGDSHSSQARSIATVFSLYSKNTYKIVTKVQTFRLFGYFNEKLKA